MRASVQRSAWVTCAAGVAVLFALVVAAQSARTRSGATVQQHVAFAYTLGAGAEHCPDEASLRASVTGTLGYDPFDARAPRAVQATIRARGRQLEGRIEVREPNSARPRTRTVQTRGRGCTELASALGLAVAIAIDPLVMTRVQRTDAGVDAELDAGAMDAESVDAADAADAAGAESADVPDVAVAPDVTDVAAPSQSAVGVELHAGAVASLGMAPGIANTPFRPGVYLDVGLNVRRTPWSVRALLRVDAPGTLSGAGGTSVTAVPLSLGLGGCGRWGDAVAFRACAITDVTAVIATGRGFENSRTGVAPGWSVGMRAGVEFPSRTTWSFEAWGELMGMLVVPGIALGGTSGGALFSGGPLWVSWGLGVRWGR